MAKVIPWSWSSYDAYQTCPRRFYEVKIAKNFTEPYAEHLVWGNDVHKGLERYIGEDYPLPNNMLRFKPIADKFKYSPGINHVELEVACTIDLQPCGFWDKDAWARGKIDLFKEKGKTALNIDWKTGKFKANPTLQLDLSTLLAFITFPHIEQINTAFVFLQNPSQPVRKQFIRDDMPMILEQFEEGVNAMTWSMEHNVWPEKPSGLCKAHCPVKTCKYYQRGAARYGRR